LCAAEFNLNFAIQARSVFLSSNAEMKSWFGRIYWVEKAENTRKKVALVS
jgi:hypothetical protein